MIRTLRKRAIENPWIFRGIMSVLAVVFIFSLGWWGIQKQEEDHHRVIATVNEDSISLDTYRRVYKNASRLYRQIAKSPVEDKVLQKQVLDYMVEQKLWLQEAARIGLRVTDAELQASILKLPGFQENGQFNPERYRSVLALEGLTPEQFEQQQREALIVKKAKSLVQDSVALTPLEMTQITSTSTQEIENRLTQKRERAVFAYTLALKRNASVVIQEEE